MAPEILLGAGHGPCVDWWSLGVLLYEMLVGFPPFNDKSPELIFENILNHSIMWPDVPEEMSSEAQDLIMQLLVADPARRLGAGGVAEVMAHPFFREVDWAALSRGEGSVSFVPKVASRTDTSYFTSSKPLDMPDSLQRSIHDTPAPASLLAARTHVPAHQPSRLAVECALSGSEEEGAQEGGSSGNQRWPRERGDGAADSRSVARRGSPAVDGTSEPAQAPPPPPLPQERSPQSAQRKLSEGACWQASPGAERPRTRETDERWEGSGVSAADPSALSFMEDASPARATLSSARATPSSARSTPSPRRGPSALLPPAACASAPVSVASSRRSSGSASPAGQPLEDAPGWSPLDREAALCVGAGDLSASSRRGSASTLPSLDAPEGSAGGQVLVRRGSGASRVAAQEYPSELAELSASLQAVGFVVSSRKRSRSRDAGSRGRASRSGSRHASPPALRADSGVSRRIQHPMVAALRMEGALGSAARGRGRAAPEPKPA